MVRAAETIKVLSADIDAINQNYLDPPQPDKPTAIEATQIIIEHAAHISTVATGILNRLNGGR